jgi:hypothetical protein
MSTAGERFVSDAKGVSAMAYRYERGSREETDKTFRAIELYGTLRIEQLGFLPFNQVFLLDSEMETLCFVEKNMDYMVNLAVRVKKMEYL